MSITLLVAGLFSILLGIWHLRVPAFFRYRQAIGEDGPGSVPLGSLGVGPVRYALRRRDLTGIAWVMSNAASYVLVSVGAVDLWLAVDPTAAASPVPFLWIAGWWAIRAAGQVAVGRRPVDLALAAWFWCLALVHVLPAVAS